MVSHGHDAWHAFFTLFVAISGSLKRVLKTSFAALRARRLSSKKQLVVYLQKSSGFVYHFSAN